MPKDTQMVQKLRNVLADSKIWKDIIGVEGKLKITPSKGGWTAQRPQAIKAFWESCN